MEGTDHVCVFTSCCGFHYHSWVPLGFARGAQGLSSISSAARIGISRVLCFFSGSPPHGSTPMPPRLYLYLYLYIYICIYILYIYSYISFASHNLGGLGASEGAPPPGELGGPRTPLFFWGSRPQTPPPPRDYGLQTNFIFIFISLSISISIFGFKQLLGSMFVSCSSPPSNLDMSSSLALHSNVSCFSPPSSYLGRA